jgi:hypothetical protein
MQASDRGIEGLSPNLSQLASPATSKKWKSLQGSNFDGQRPTCLRERHMLSLPFGTTLRRRVESKLPCSIPKVCNLRVCGLLIVRKKLWEGIKD